MKTVKTAVRAKFVDVVCEPCGGKMSITRTESCMDLPFTYYYKCSGCGNEETSKEAYPRHEFENISWSGCGECDCNFPCNNGEERCVRLPPKTPKLEVIKELKELAEFWIQRDTRNLQSSEDWKIWHALGFGSSAMEKAREVITDESR
jgi:hypothetical protein